MTQFKRHIGAVSIVTILASLFSTGEAKAQTFNWTSPNITTVTNSSAWGFGAGSIPFSSNTGILNYFAFGTTNYASGLDLNLTLNILNLNSFSTSAPTLNIALVAGTYAFTGAAQINFNGGGAQPLISSPIVLSSTLTSLTFGGSGGSGVGNVSAIISSNTALGAPVIIAGTFGSPNFGGVTLAGTNTFGGGVVLNSGTLSVTNPAGLGIFGSTFNTLTVNGGNFVSNQTIINPIVANVDFVLEGGNTVATFGAAGGLGIGGISGVGGVQFRQLGVNQQFNVANTYTGATTIGQIRFATTSSPDSAGGLFLASAAGTMLNTSGIFVNDGGLFTVAKNVGDSATNNRLNPLAVITVNSGFVQLVGSAGFTTTTFGPITASGYATVLAATSGAVTSQTVLNTSGVTRSGNAFVAFFGANLGNQLAAVGGLVSSANIIFTGAPPVLTGGGGAPGTTNISIIPWAVGDTSNTSLTFTAGTGFVTYGANGIRLLTTAAPNEYVNTFAAAAATDNVRLLAAGAIAAPTTVNSVFAQAGFGIAGVGQTLTITSGAYATATTSVATTTANLNFPGGEAIISTINAFTVVGTAANTLTISGNITATTLTKSGHGILNLTGTNTIANLVVNAGFIQAVQFANIGLTSPTNPIIFYGSSFQNRSGIYFTGALADVIPNPIQINSGHVFIGNTSPGVPNVTLSGIISGSGGLNAGLNANSGMLTLTNAANNFSGGLRLGQGGLTFGTDSNLGAATGPITIAGAGSIFSTIVLTGNWTTTRGIAFESGLGASTGGGFNTNGFNSTWGGPIMGLGNIFKINAGTWTIASAGNPYNGNIQLGNTATFGGVLAFTTGDLNSATITFGPAAAGVAGTYTLDLSGAVGPGAGTPWRQVALLNTNTNFTQAHTVLLGAAPGTPVDLRVGAGTFGGTAGVISGFGKLVKVGNGALTLNGSAAHTFTGNVEIWGGSLSILADNLLGNAANNILIQGGHTISATSTNPSTLIVIGSINTPRNFSLGGSTLPITNAMPNAINASGGNLTITGVVSDAFPGVPGGFEKFGSLALSLTGINTYSGVTRISAGALSFNTDANLGTGPIVLNGGTLASGGGVTATLTRPFYIIATSTLTNGNGAGINLVLNGPIIGGAFALSLTTSAIHSIVFGGNSPYFHGTITSAASVSGSNIVLTGSMPEAIINLGSSGVNTLDMTNLARRFQSVTIGVGASVQLGASGVLTTGVNATNITPTWTGNVLGGAGASVVKGYAGGNTGITIQSNGNTFSGGFHVLATGGTGVITLNTNGTLPLQSAMTLGTSFDVGATFFRLDNTATNLGTRLSDTQAIHANNADFIFSTNTTTATTEVIDAYNIGGYNTITMTTGGTLNFANAVSGLTRIDRGTLFVRSGASNILGTGVGSLTFANVTFGNSGTFTLIGGSGSPGTEVPILPYFVGHDVIGASTTGNTFMTYGANGIRPLAAAEYLSTFGAHTSFSNLRLIASATLGANTAINALAIAGTTSTLRLDLGGNRLTIESGAILNSITQVYSATNTFTAVVAGIHNGELQTGSGNTNELIFHNQSFDLNVGALITTTGGLTKSGLGILYLTNNANTYTGGTNVNAGTLSIDNLGAINDAGGSPLTLSGGNLRYRGTSATLTSPVVLGGGSATNGGGLGSFNVVPGTTLTISSPITGFGGLGKQGNGILVLSGAHNYTGITLLNAGVLAINNAGSLGTNPLMNFGSTGVIRFDAPMTFTKNFQTTSAVVTNAGFTFNTNGNNVILSGVMSGGVGLTNPRGLTKFGAGDLMLTNASNYTGATVVLGGNLILGSANGSILATNGSGGFIGSGSIVVHAGAGLILDNLAIANSNRLPDGFSMPFATTYIASTSQGIQVNAGEFRIRGNVGLAVNEFVNRVSVFAGTFSLENNGANVTLTSARLVRTSTASVGLIRGNNLGSTPSATSTNWFAMDMGEGSVSLLGAGGALGTPFINIVPGFAGDSSSSNGVGTDLITYDSAVGIRLLTGSEYTSTIPTLNYDNSRAPNIVVTGPTIAPDTSSWVTAIKLTAGGALNGTASIDVRASTILATGNSSINVPVLQANSNVGYAFLTTGAATTLTINSALNSAGLFKYGAGTLTLTNAMYGAGVVYVGQGTMLLSGANAVLNPGSTSLLVISPGATLDLGGVDRIFPVIGTISSLGTTGLNVVTDGTVSLGAANLTIYDSSASLFSGNFTGTGGITKALFASGTMTLSQPQSYTGTTRLFAGTLSLAGAATLASTLIDIRGGTLAFTNSTENSVGMPLVQNRTPAATINLAGTLNVTNNAETIMNVSFGTINLVGGGTILATATGAPTTLTIANLNRATNRGTLTLSGTNLGLPLNPAGSTNILATNIDGAAPALSLFGAGGAAGTTTVSIIPWMTTGLTFITYGANGFRPLDFTLEYNTLITAGATVNVRTTAAAVLAANTEVNSLLVTSGTVSGAFDLTIASGALTTNSVGTTIGANTNQLLTGVAGVNNKELFLNTDTLLTLAYNVNTSGGVTKFGVSAVTLTGTNNFTGGLNIQAGLVVYTLDSQLGAAGQPIRFGGNASALTSRGLQYTGTTAVVLNRNIELTGYGMLTTPSNVVMVVNGTITGTGGLGMAQSTSQVPILELNNVNTFTGDLFQEQGYFSFANDSALGNPANTLQMFSGGSLEGLIQRGNWTASRNIHARLSFAINTNGFDTNFSGIMFGTSSIFRYGTGTFTVLTPQPVTAAFTMNAGNFRLFNRGALAGTALTLNAGARLTLDDTGTRYSDRIPDGMSITMTSSELRLLGNSGVPTEELINGLTLNGQATVTLQPGAGQSATLQLLGTLTRGSGSAILFRGTDLGLNNPGTANSANLMVFSPANSAAALTGGGGAPGTTYMSIIAGAYIDTTATGFGTQLATYDLVKGIRPLTASEYTNSLVNGTVMSDNVHVTGGTTTINNATTINALWLDTAALVNGTGVLTVTAGNVLVSGTGNSIAGPITTPQALSIGGTGDLSISGAITATGGLIKNGSGSLTILTAQTYSVGTILAQGALVFGSTTSFGSLGINVLGGSLRASAAGLFISNSITLNGDVTFDGLNDYILSSTITLSNATRKITVGSGRTILSNAVGFVGSSGVAAIGLTKDGPGTLILGTTTGNAYGGSSAGYYHSITTVNAGELRIANSSGSATGGSTVVVNGPTGKLAGTGIIVPAQQLVARNTIAINGGGMVSPGAGTSGTLTFGSAATPGVTTASVSLASGAIYNFAYFNVPAPVTALANTGTSLTPGSGNNTMVINGVLTIDPGTFVRINANIADFNPADPYSFQIASATSLGSAVSITSPLQFDTTSFIGFTGQYSFDLTSSGTNVFLNFTPVPEPTSLLLLGAAAVGLGRYVRRRRNRNV